jgi:hypothetical protein
MNGDSVLSIEIHMGIREREREREEGNGDKKGAYICDYTLYIKRRLFNQIFCFCF